MDGVFKEELSHISKKVLTTLSALVIIFAQVGVVIWWLAGVASNVKLIPEMQAEIIKYGSAAKVHSLELAAIRERQFDMQEQVEVLRKDMQARTNDRFRKEEFEAWRKSYERYVEARFKECAHMTNRCND